VDALHLLCFRTSTSESLAPQVQVLANLPLALQEGELTQLDCHPSSSSSKSLSSSDSSLISSNPNFSAIVSSSV